ncbi:unnamed protein product [Paramecium octaurelia]|uniref:Uncharacterized protein n=1 Tax=Paramecium octaurelia TaxID=43137 RepID=A0A8S1WQR7_PAROT|nr:unnamed protein product [Paramecium octaurelia]
MGVCQISQTADYQSLQLISARQNLPQESDSSREPSPSNSQEKMNIESIKQKQQQEINQGSGEPENEMSNNINKERMNIYEATQQKINFNIHSHDQYTNSSRTQLGQIYLNSNPLNINPEPELRHNFIVSNPKLTLNK